MLELNHETVCFVIAKAREFQAKEEVVIPEVPGSPGDDWALQVLADHGDDWCLQEVRDIVDDMEPIQQVELVVLMWIGRGDFDVDEWDDAIVEGKGAWTPRTADYLMSTPLVADYLEEGLAAFGHSCNE